MCDDLTEVIDELDTSWIDDFNEIDKDYNTYYTEKITFIKVKSIYINANKEIEKTTDEKIIFRTAGIMTKEELIGIIKHNSVCNNFNYSLLSILTFIINIEPQNLKTFLRNKSFVYNPSFFTSKTSIENIFFDKSISMFHDINELIIIYHQKNRPHLLIEKQKTKKLHFISISNTKKKTKRKQYKD